MLLSWQGGFGSFAPCSPILNKLKSGHWPWGLRHVCPWGSLCCPILQETPFPERFCLTGLWIRVATNSGLEELFLKNGSPFPSCKFFLAATVQVVMGQQKRFVPPGEK